MAAVVVDVGMVILEIGDQRGVPDGLGDQRCYWFGWESGEGWGSGRGVKLCIFARLAKIRAWFCS